MNIMHTSGISDDFVGDQIRRTNRNLLLANTALLLLLGGLAAANWRYLKNVLEGPQPIGPAALVQLSDPSNLDRYYFEVSGLDPRLAGIWGVDPSAGAVSSRWVLLKARIGHKSLLIKANREAPERVYAGQLTPIEPAIRRRLEQLLLRDGAAAEGSYDEVFYPYSLDATGFDGSAVVGLLIGIPLALFTLWNMQSGIARGRDRRRCPSIKRLERFGMIAGRPADSSINEEFRAGGSSLLRNTWVSESWLTHQSVFDFHAVRLDDVVWVFERIVTLYYGILPCGRRRELVIFDREGQRISCGGSKTLIALAIQRLALRVPWAIYGYSDEWNDLMIYDREAFLRAVSERQPQAHDEPIQAERVGVYGRGL